MNTTKSIEREIKKLPSPNTIVIGTAVVIGAIVITGISHLFFSTPSVKQDEILSYEDNNTIY